MTDEELADERAVCIFAVRDVFDRSIMVPGTKPGYFLIRGSELPIRRFKNGQWCTRKNWWWMPLKGFQRIFGIRLKPGEGPVKLSLGWNVP